jgi:hypothetical protein
MLEKSTVSPAAFLMTIALVRFTGLTKFDDETMAGFCCADWLPETMTGCAGWPAPEFGRSG